ncbi:MAG: hypothetical protein P1V51_13910 [Deltaproteobacteria bacterium]|nr:hypothetical protein [Deltaproteobacteria bacterium]
MCRLASLLSLAALAALLGATPALAATFDPLTGTVSMAPESEGIGWDLENLETMPAELPTYVYTARWDPVQDNSLVTRFVYDERVIEGQGALALGGGLYRTLTVLTALRERFAGRRVEFVFWQKPEGTQLAGDVSWYGGDVDTALANGTFDGLVPLASLSFQPTGKLTDDGWREMSTGPVDWELGGAIAPAMIMLSDTHASGMWGNPSISFDPSLRVLFDAFDIVDVGPAVTANDACTLGTEASVCAAGSVCRMGRCVEAAPMVGPMILDPGARRDYTERRLMEYSRFDGSREAMNQLPAITLAWATLATAATPEKYWPEMEGLVEQLRDGHASAPTWGYGAMLYDAGACMTLGEADLLSTPVQAPVIIDRAFQHPIGSQVRVGDVLTSVDGMPFAEWRDLAEPILSFGGDPAAHDAVVTGQILSAAMMVGSTLEFSRCPALDAAGTACADPIETVTVDLAPATAELWTGGVPAWMGGYTQCDFRFQRMPTVTDPAGFTTAASIEDAGVRHLLFNGFPSEYQRGGTEWAQALESALGDAPPRVVVDQRQGYGGTADAMNYATSFFLGGNEFDRLELYPNTDLTLDGTLQGDLRSCLPTAQSFLPCGYHDSWRLTDFPNPSASAVSTSRVALLLTSDVSGNDFFTKMVDFRSAPTRIFGPAPTWGAFGPIVELPGHLGELSAGSFQIQDTVFFTDASSDPVAFTTGSGVAPDEVVLQKQSDAIAGVDTLLQAAIDWVNQ